ncbi:MAG: gamma-glutamyltransferase [Chloroflexota bacterium]|nr:gamma-glutamyltransferase [Chloroflexota bacterium]
MRTRPTIRAVNGLVASGHHLATVAGIESLREGGSATDAAVAAAAVCAVVLPHRTSIGGDLFALVYDARTRRVTAYNGSGAASRHLDVESFAGGYPSGGTRTATVPGVVAAWEDLMADWGRLGLERALRSAIHYAAHGFPVSDVLAGDIAEHSAALAADPGCARVFRPRELGVGEILVQPELAAALREIAEQGATAFYRGALAERLADGIARLGGDIDREDLAAHATERRDPLSVDYRGFRVFGQPPVSQGHVLLEELAIASGRDFSGMEWGGADLVHEMVEIKKLAFADRDAHAGDPRAVAFSAEALLDPAFVEARRAALPGRATERVDAGALAAAMPADTTYLAVVDRDGNAVSLIESVFSAFGAVTIVPETGVLLNSRLTGFSLDPASPNALAPGKRPVHTLNAAMALDGARPRFVFGTPGRQAQVQTNFQLAVALIDHGLDVQEAIDQPRWYHERGRELRIEARYPQEVRRALAEKGHDVRLLPDWAEVTGGAQAIAVDPRGVLAGGADPRREGLAAGY